ncbi:MAG: hypothetical protein HY319_24595 [Armatimonadetes bacterium]|nr:hypothetical protein [Armatimonadota bacterium]
MSDLRLFYQVDFECYLSMPNGGRSAETRSRTWFFEVPEARTGRDDWNELLQRIFYDLNVVLRRSEPGEGSWIALEDFRTTSIDPAEVLSWVGRPRHTYPWIEAENSRIWEPSVCFFVDDFGRYDVMTADDFTELILYRTLRAGALDTQGFVHYLNGYARRNVGQIVYDAREERFGNLIVVRELQGVYRKEPGSQPWTSGPVDPGLLS